MSHTNKNVLEVTALSLKTIQRNCGSKEGSFAKSILRKRGGDDDERPGDAKEKNLCISSASSLTWISCLDNYFHQIVN